MSSIRASGLSFKTISAAMHAVWYVPLILLDTKTPSTSLPRWMARRKAPSSASMLGCEDVGSVVMFARRP
jgi:hypothetical protein